MPNAKDVQVTTEHLKVMSVGESGTGKSIFASSFPTPGFIFDFGNEIISYRGKDFDYESYDVSAQGWAKFEKDFELLFGYKPNAKITKVNDNKVELKITT